MNNALQIQEEEKKSPISPEEKAKLVNIVEAIDELLRTKAWRTLEELHFKEEEARVERLILAESKKDQIKTEVLYKLQGELKWAKRYASLETFARILKVKLGNLKKHGS